MRRRGRIRRVSRLGFPAALCLVPSACAGWFFSGVPTVDRSQPVAVVETTDGVEHAATTELGVLFLGRTAKEGPCRVHYFLGPTPLVESGRILAAGGMFYRAEIDLKVQNIEVLDRPIGPEDDILAMYAERDGSVRSAWVELAHGDSTDGNLLDAYGTELPAGAAVLVPGEDGEYRFAGLVTAKATMRGDGAPREYYVYAGLDRVREMMLVPDRYPADTEAIYRPDDITVIKEIK